MIKAIIESIESDYLYKVRIPIYHKIENTIGATPTRELPTAPVCTMPGVYPHYQIGDIVWVDFENGEIGYPVILGLLYREEESKSVSDVKFSSLTVDNDAILPEGTSIGNVKESITALPQIVRTVENLSDIVENLSP